LIISAVESSKLASEAVEEVATNDELILDEGGEYLSSKWQPNPTTIANPGVTTKAYQQRYGVRIEPEDPSES
jgi:hypothetical protein